ncbi:OmpA family protein [Helicobacter baculiformis]|uniref:OmpA family protein n=1 Tax=Helicobacter baculiformis TaxID=427351 RepID=A0ABV7ZGU5_9HELI|nr:OmpA family protein [Helicobacter baculiformis]
MNKWAIAGALAALLVITGCGSGGKAKPAPKTPQGKSAQNAQEKPVENKTLHPEGAQKEGSQAPHEQSEESEEGEHGKNNTSQAPHEQSEEGKNNTSQAPHEQSEESEEGVNNASQAPHEQVKSGSIVSQVYFDFDKYNIRTDMQDAVEQGAQKIQEYKMKVLLEGNTDEFGTGEYNFALGNKRALSVKQALVLKGIDQDSIRTVSFGETKPICQEKTRECYQKNRRVDIKVVQ